MRSCLPFGRGSSVSKDKAYSSHCMGCHLSWTISCLGACERKAVGVLRWPVDEHLSCAVVGCVVWCGCGGEIKQAILAAFGKTQHGQCCYGHSAHASAHLIHSSARSFGFISPVLIRICHALDQDSHSVLWDSANFGWEYCQWSMIPIPCCTGNFFSKVRTLQLLLSPHGAG